MPTVKALSEHTSILVTNTDESIDGADSGNLAYSAIGRRDYVAKTSSYTATDDDDVINLSSASNQAITLPACASTRVGKTYTIRKGSNNGTAVNILTTGGNTINGASYVQISKIGSFVTVQNTGSEWLIIGQHGWFNGLSFANTDTTSVNTSTSELSLIPTGTGYTTFPAAFFTAATAVQMRLFGSVSNTSTPTLTLKFKLGSVVCTTGAITTASGLSSTGWTMVAQAVCMTTGGSGLFWLEGMVTLGANNYPVYVGGPHTLDTTGALALAITAQWGTSSASNTISCANLSVSFQR